MPEKTSTSKADKTVVTTSCGKRKLPNWVWCEVSVLIRVTRKKRTTLIYQMFVERPKPAKHKQFTATNCFAVSRPKQPFPARRSALLPRLPQTSFCAEPVPEQRDPASQPRPLPKAPLVHVTAERKRQDVSYGVPRGNEGSSRHDLFRPRKRWSLTRRSSLLPSSFPAGAGLRASRRRVFRKCVFGFFRPFPLLLLS